MVFWNSYTDAFRYSINNDSFSVAQLDSLGKNMNIDTTLCCKVFLCLSNNKRFHINNQIYDVSYGDLFFISSNEWHYFSNYSMEENHERIIFFVTPRYLEMISSNQTDLASCFAYAEKNSSHRICLNESEIKRILFFAELLRGCNGYASEVLERCYFTELLVYLNGLVNKRKSENNTSDSGGYTQGKLIKNVITFIDHHINQELTIEILSKRFNVSSTYLSRIFKAEMGTSIHKYIIVQRITLAKKLLLSSSNVSEVCDLCGFNDYNHFIRTFTKTVGISPKKYASRGK